MLSHADKNVLYLDSEDYLVQIQNIQDLAILTHENLLFRYFNSLKVDGTKIVKQSKNKEKYMQNIVFC